MIGCDCGGCVGLESSSESSELELELELDDELDDDDELELDELEADVAVFFELKKNKFLTVNPRIWSVWYDFNAYHNAHAKVDLRTEFLASLR